MATKLIKDIVPGDVVRLREPDGAARVTAKAKSRLFQASGGCWELDLKITEGPHKGQKMRNQAYPGDSEVELVE